MRAKYLLCSAGIIVAFCITGCDGRREQDAKTDPNQYCFPFYKETGEAVEYIDAGETKRTTQFLEYQTAAGFKMRILRGTGGLGHPNKQCQVETGGFSFRWANGRLMPRWDYKTGKRNTEGSLVEYFVRFHPPSQRLAEKFDYPEWMFEGAFRIPGHERVVVMPFAGYANAQGIPADRNNRSLWRPRLLLEDARGPADSFNCGPLSNEEKDGELHVFFKISEKTQANVWAGSNLVLALRDGSIFTTKIFLDKGLRLQKLSLMNLIPKLSGSKSWHISLRSLCNKNYVRNARALCPTN